jgi:hypothetical protein
MTIGKIGGPDERLETAGAGAGLGGAGAGLGGIG